jgi:hypothetical protein
MDLSGHIFREMRSAKGLVSFGMKKKSWKSTPNAEYVRMVYQISKAFACSANRQELNERHKSTNDPTYLANV